MQQGKFLAKNIRILLNGKSMKPFHYKDQGAMATIGRNKAVADVKIFEKEFRYKGLIAWLIWMFVHLISIIGFRNKLVVVINWMFSYFSYDKGMRLIIGQKKENLPTESVAEKAVIN